MAVIGYREKEGSSEQSFAPCVKVLKYLGTDSETETCEEVDASNGQTHFVRIFTAYGVCGESWVTDNQGYFGRDFSRVSGNSCVIRSE